jgi:hypothetical protein
LRPLGGPEHWVVAHDFAPTRGRPIATDHVLGVSASTMALAGATIRRPIGAAFDLGTGCGVQALYASSHSERVVASDLNQRAVALSMLTMELNRVTTVSVRSGNLFDPVAQETFELVVANPPFVISPSHQYLFRDAPAPIDELCRTLVSRPRTPGGHCRIGLVGTRGAKMARRLAGWTARAVRRIVLARD